MIAGVDETVLWPICLFLSIAVICLSAVICSVISNYYQDKLERLKWQRK